MQIVFVSVKWYISKISRWIKIALEKDSIRKINMINNYVIYTLLNRNFHTQLKLKLYKFMLKASTNTCIQSLKLKGVFMSVTDTQKHNIVLWSVVLPFQFIHSFYDLAFSIDSNAKVLNIIFEFQTWTSRFLSCLVSVSKL